MNIQVKDLNETSYGEFFQGVLYFHFVQDREDTARDSELDMSEENYYEGVED